MDIKNDINNAIINNIKYQKQNRKNKYTKSIYFKIIEEFISNKKLVCYGGTAINMYLPKEHQFYNEDDIPDYDCFSNNALKDSIELSKKSNIYNKWKFKIMKNSGPYINFAV
jgi:hypothetical protein